MAFVESLPDVEAREDERSSMELVAEPLAVWARVERRMAGRLPRATWSEAAVVHARGLRRTAGEVRRALRHLLGGATWLELADALLLTIAREGS